MSNRVELAWCQFIAPARLDSQSSSVPAMAKSSTTSLWKGIFDGESVVFVEDPSLTLPAKIPWHNIAAFAAIPVELKSVAKAKDAA